MESNGVGVESQSIREDERKLFIGGLSLDTSDDDLREYFGRFGEVENVNLKKDPYTQKSRGFAFVVFKEKEPLDKVLNEGTHEIKGKSVDPKKAKVRTGKIFVGGLNSEMSDDDIKNHFSQFGKIIEVEMPFDKQKNQRKGFCFITFEYEDIMKDIIKEPKQTICGKQVDVKKATPRTDAGGAFGMGGGRGARGAPRGRGRGRGVGGFQGGWYQYGSPGYGGYDYGGGYGDSSGGGGYYGSDNSGYDNSYGGYGGGYGSGYGGGYGTGYGGGKSLQGRRGNPRSRPY